MNIHQLLSANPGSPQLQTQGALSQQDSANGLFRQVLLQASDGQGVSAVAPSGAAFAPPTTLQAQIGSLGSRLVEDLIGDSEGLSKALKALGINISEQELSQLSEPSELSELLAQLQIRPTPMAAEERVPSAAIDASTPLDEIAARLTLISSFSDESRSLPVDSSAALEAVAENLGIDLSEAAHLVSVLNAFVVQSQGGQPSFADKARPATITPLPVDLSPSQRLQTDSLLGSTSAYGSSPQVSSDALMGSLLTLERIPKTNQMGEPSLPGAPLSALNAQQQLPLASAQSALGVATSASPAQTLLSAPVTSPAWSQQLGQQLVQFSQRGGEQHIQMQLNPVELGPLSISLKFSEQGAQAHFLSASAQVRQVLELAIPQLREALAEQGISLGDTSVGEQRDPNAQAFAQSGSSKGAGISDGDTDASRDEASTPGIEGTPIVLDGRVDLYA